MTKEQKKKRIYKKLIDMHGRTFFRIMFDYIFFNNAFCRAMRAFVDFCNEQRNNYPKTLKFSENVPLKISGENKLPKKETIQYGVLGSIYVNKCNK